MFVLNESFIFPFFRFFFFITGQGTFSKLNREEYILDEAACYVRRHIQFDLIFQRTVWYFPLKHMDNEIYVDMMFHQVGP